MRHFGLLNYLIRRSVQAALIPRWCIFHGVIVGADANLAKAASVESRRAFRLANRRQFFPREYERCFRGCVYLYPLSRTRKTGQSRGAFAAAASRDKTMPFSADIAARTKRWSWPVRGTLEGAFRASVTRERDRSSSPAISRRHPINEQDLPRGPLCGTRCCTTFAALAEWLVTS